MQDTVGGGGCTAVGLAKLGVFPSVDEAKAKLNALIPKVAAKLGRTGEDVAAFVGVEDDCWHPEVVKRAVIDEGWHFHKLHLSSVDLREEVKSGSLLIDGVLNDSYVRTTRRGDSTILGLTPEGDGFVRVPTDPDDTTSPITNEAGWRHMIATRNGQVLEKEFSLPTDWLWLGFNSQPDPKKGYLYKVLKVYRVFKCKSKRKGCKGECQRKRPRVG